MKRVYALRSLILASFTYCNDSLKNGNIIFVHLYSVSTHTILLILLIGNMFILNITNKNKVYHKYMI